MKQYKGIERIEKMNQALVLFTNYMKEQGLEEANIKDIKYQDDPFFGNPPSFAISIIIEDELVFFNILDNGDIIEPKWFTEYKDRLSKYEPGWDKEFLV